MSFCGTRLTPCRKLVSTATLSRAIIIIIILIIFKCKNFKCTNIINYDDYFLCFLMSVGLTGRPRPQHWFTRSLEVTSGQEVLTELQKTKCLYSDALSLHLLFWVCDSLPSRPDWPV